MLTVFVIVVMLFTIVSRAGAEEKASSPQAQRMKDCNVQARERALSGEARKQFMSDCLKGSGAGRSDGQAGNAPEPAAQSGTTPQSTR